MDEGKLTKKENDTLEKLEAIIKENLQAFYKVGSALLRIREERLYRKTHETFEDYCRDKWEIGRSTAYQYIDSVKVIENVRNCGQILPVNESQTRPLSHLAPELQKEAWSKVVETAPEGKITARHVNKIVNEIKATKIKNQNKIFK